MGLEKPSRIPGSPSELDPGVCFSKSIKKVIGKIIGLCKNNGCSPLYVARHHLHKSELKTIIRGLQLQHATTISLMFLV